MSAVRGPVDPDLMRRARSAATGPLIGVVLLSAATIAVVIGQAGAITAAVTAAVGGVSPVSALLVLGGCLVARGVLQAGQARLAALAARRVKTDLRHELLDVVLDPRRMGSAPRASQFALLIDRGLDRLDDHVARFVPQLVVAVLAPLVVVAVLLVIDPLSALIVIVTVPLVVGFLILVGLSTQDRLDDRWQELSRLGRHLGQAIEATSMLTLFGRRQDDGLRATGQRHREATMAALRQAFLSAFVLELFSTLSVALTAVTVGLRVVEDHLDLSTGLFVLLIVPEAYAPIRRLGALFHESADGVEASREAHALLHAGRHTGRTRPSPSGDLVIEDLVVSVDGRADPLLRTATERIRPGEFVAIVGDSGCGKTTLLSVILGFTEPTEGRIVWDGADVRDLDIEQWRSSIAWVPQFPSLISGTIADNVRLAWPEASESAVRAALAAAGAADLPAGRLVAESGADLSAGERRRIGVARALLRVNRHPCALVLMDEPTAGLDHDRELEVLSSLRQTGATVVVVAHRPETIEAADRVIDLSRAMAR